MSEINIWKSGNRKITNLFPYDPEYISKVKKIDGIQRNDRQSTSSILPKQDKRRSTSFMNEICRHAAPRHKIGGLSGYMARTRIWRLP